MSDRLYFRNKPIDNDNKNLILPTTSTIEPIEEIEENTPTPIGMKTIHVLIFPIEPITFQFKEYKKYSLYALIDTGITTSTCRENAIPS
ncbi:hypothetical protein GQ457_12G016710 [Hibiscus cannabinus]